MSYLALFYADFKIYLSYIIYTFLIYYTFSLPKRFPTGAGSAIFMERLREFRLSAWYQLIRSATIAFAHIRFGRPLAIRLQSIGNWQKQVASVLLGSQYARRRRSRSLSITDAIRIIARILFIIPSDNRIPNDHGSVRMCWSAYSSRLVTDQHSPPYRADWAYHKMVDFWFRSNGHKFVA